MPDGAGEKLETERRNCPRCKGGGWASAARDAGLEDAPFALQPLGIYVCPDCGGLGKTPGSLLEGLTPEGRRRLAALRDSVAAQIRKLEAKRQP